MATHDALNIRRITWFASKLMLPQSIRTTEDIQLGWAIKGRLLMLTICTREADWVIAWNIRKYPELLKLKQTVWRSCLLIMVDFSTLFTRKWLVPCLH